MKFYMFSIAILTALFSNCSNNHNSGSSGLDGSIGGQTTKGLTLNDSILQIREWFKTINSNIATYEVVKKKNRNIRGFSEITEYKTTLKDKDSALTHKIVYTSDYLNEKHLLLSKNDSLINITREYYYWENTLFFVFEIIKYAQSGSKTKKMENRFYLDDHKMIRWLRDTADINKGNKTYYQIQESFFSQQYKDLLYPYSLSKQIARGKINYKAETPNASLKIFKNAMAWRYSSQDTIHLLDSAFSRIYQFKIAVNSLKDIKSSFYILTIEKNDKDNLYNASGKLIGNYYNSTKKIKTPGDVFWTIIEIEDKRDIKTLQTFISKKGFKSYIEESPPGDSDEPPYVENNHYTRDETGFECIGSIFDTGNFNSGSLEIPETFGDNGFGTVKITYFTGGYWAGIDIEKNERGVFLLSFDSRGGI